MRRIAHRLVYLSPLPRVRVFDREAGFTNLRRVCRGDASELGSDVVDDIEIAVSAVVVPQAQIGADCLRIRRVHLKETGERQKAGKGVVCLQACQRYREIPIGQRQSKSIPSLGSGNRELCCGPIIGPHAEFIQGAAVVSAEALEEIVSKPPILPRPVSQLMTGVVIQAVRNEHVLVNMKGGGNQLREHVRDIVIGVGPVVEVSAERPLPFLCRDHVTCIGRMENESLELQFANASNPGSDFEGQIPVCFI